MFYVHAPRAVYVTPELSNKIGFGIDFGVCGGLFKVNFNFQTRRRLLGAELHLVAVTLLFEFAFSQERHVDY